MSDQQQMRSVAIILLAIAMLVTAIVSLVVISGDSDKPQAGLQSGGDFTLQSSSGPVSLKQFRGQVVLLFFGYTHCPAICPTTMCNVAEAMNLLNKAENDRVQPLFITVDPARDSVEHLSKYTSFFHPKLIGLSGSEEAIKRVAEKYSVQFFRDNSADSGHENYLVNHTSYLFLIDGQGKVADLMSSNTLPQDIAAAVRRHIPRAQ